MDSEELSILKRKVESGTCTLLELHNIQMYVALNAGKDVLKNYVAQEIEAASFSKGKDIADSSVTEGDAPK